MIDDCDPERFFQTTKPDPLSSEQAEFRLARVDPAALVAPLRLKRKQRPGLADRALLLSGWSDDHPILPSAAAKRAAERAILVVVIRREAEDATGFPRTGPEKSAAELAREVGTGC